MAEKILGKLAFWMIPIIALVILALVYFGPRGAFVKIKELTPNANDIDTEDQLPSIQPTIPEEHRIAINRMIDTIRNNMLAETANNCFENYKEPAYNDLVYGRQQLNGLPNLGEDGTAVEIQYASGEARTRIYTGPESS